MHWAVLRGHEQVVELLIKSGANVNAEAKQLTPMHMAARDGYQGIVELLAKNGANLNTQDIIVCLVMLLATYMFKMFCLLSGCKFRNNMRQISPSL